jgi:hypothetical protein
MAGTDIVRTKPSLFQRGTSRWAAGKRVAGTGSPAICARRSWPASRRSRAHRLAGNSTLDDLHTLLLFHRGQRGDLARRVERGAGNAL